MLKKLLTNKALLAGAAVLVLGVALLAAGLTAAWFNKSGDSGVARIDNGFIKLTATLEGDPDGTWDIPYQPGFNAYWGTASIANTGSLDAFVRFDIGVTTTVKSDADGELLAQADWEEVQNDPNVTLVLDSDCLGYAEDGDGVTLYAWYVDADGVYYLYLKAGESAPMEEAVGLLLDGPGMGNEYMRAHIEVSLHWEATQFMLDAIQDIFGVDVNTDLTAIDNDQSL